MDIYCHFLYNTARGDLMLANFEKRNYEDHCHIWIGGYRNLHNLAHWHMETELIYIEQGRQSFRITMKNITYEAVI